MIGCKQSTGPGAIYGAKGPAEKEEQKNRARILAGQTPSFAVYKRDEIKAALHLLFHGKCAYCESRYVATQPMDVEHWRPKSEVHEPYGTVVRHQYSFLAADWSNLLPSCIDCNRERIHDVVFPDRTRRTLKLGKGNRFPVQGARAKDRVSLSNEVVLLLNPYVDTPEDHLEFMREGVVRPRNGSTKAENSIEVYALNRSGLVNERYERVLLVEKSIHTIRKLAQVLEGTPDPKASNVIKDLIGYEMTALRMMREERQPYSLLARQLIDQFFASRDGMPKLS
jgi:uncharacterized protein (TIGR02646 family)